MVDHASLANGTGMVTASGPVSIAGNSSGAASKHSRNTMATSIMDAGRSAGLIARHWSTMARACFPADSIKIPSPAGAGSSISHCAKAGGSTVRISPLEASTRSNSLFARGQRPLSNRHASTPKAYTSHVSA